MGFNSAEKCPSALGQKTKYFLQMGIFAPPANDTILHSLRMSPLGHIFANVIKLQTVSSVYYQF